MCFQSCTLPHSSNLMLFYLTLFQSNALPISHSSNFTLFQSHAFPISHSSNFTLFQFHTLPISHSFNLTLCQSYSYLTPFLSHFSNHTHLQSHILPVSHSSNLTLFQSHTLPISHSFRFTLFKYYTQLWIWEEKNCELFPTYFTSLTRHTIHIEVLLLSVIAPVFSLLASNASQAS